MTCYPILSQIDPSTVELVSRKVSRERMISFTGQSIDAAQSLYNHGIQFTCEVKVASMIFQTLYRCWINMQSGNPEESAIAIDLMLNGIIDKIVVE